MLHMATEILLEIVQERNFPEFITTYLNVDHTSLASFTITALTATHHGVQATL